MNISAGFIDTPEGEPLRRETRPLWLWDTEDMRIIWANEACLDYCGASSLLDLTRVRFRQTSPFASQLQKLAAADLGPDGSRELIRFPLLHTPKAGSSSKERIFDCHCRNMDGEGGTVGLAVALVLEKEQQSKSELNPEPAQEAEPTPTPVIIAESVPQAPTLIIDPGRNVNGHRVGPEQVDDEDLLTLQEIARMINGPATMQLSGLSDDEPREEESLRPAVATRGQGAGDKPLANGHHEAGSLDAPFRLPQQDPLPIDKDDDPQQSKKKKKAKKKKAQKVKAGRIGTESANTGQTREPSNLKTGVSERNYFLESLPAALAIAMGGRLMRANEAFLYAFGYASEADLRKAGGLAVLFPNSDKGVLAAPGGMPVNEPQARRTIRSTRIVTLAVSRSGRKRTIPIAFRTISTGQEPVQILILQEDALLQEEAQSAHEGQLAALRSAGGTDETVSELGRNDEETQKSVSKERIDFLAKVSHEVRTPLNSIIGFSELMKDEQFGPVDEKKFRGYAEDIHESALHALSLINDLLDISKIVAGKPDLDFGAVDVQEAVVKAGKLMRAQAERKKISLTIDAQDGLPPVLADRRSLKQILLNLLSNAIKFTSPGGRVTVMAHEDEEGGIVLAVRDTGIGMRRDQLDVALEPFAQLDRSHRQKTQNGSEKGTGLGLPLTKALVLAHFAEFEIDSVPGRGTSITVRFPPDRLAS